MFIAKKLSDLGVQFIENNSSTSESNLEKIHYGLLVFILNTLHTIILFLIAYFLGILTYAFIAYSLFACVRLFASGVHSSSTLSCCISTYTFIFGNVYISLNTEKNIVLTCIIFLLSFILMFLYAPADTLERPLVSKNLRKSLKIKSLVLVSINFACAILIKNKIYANLITYAVLEAAFVITPLAYKLFNKKYNNYKNFDY